MSFGVAVCSGFFKKARSVDEYLIQVIPVRGSWL